ncbi:MAG TPA: cobyrinic acid a,c-diamide synthase [Hydrogenophaga sp.]|uniref:ParA family protein n=1 Tax=Hydrogenophaga sp. TaxID=1904254 RepID=UPI0008CBFC88|nr:ParA family protein [Hydrogenophaga sp.]OGA76120.1 MAG: cobyrinic acid a,c-diamide synthase [Burkholderiales bacterium GWE1_65_30]OGA91086.1 MAG: cobyrinic acid a,c-diamide synthase [Burkholderiales bacterium GWF1_66_17]HAX23324.1 cobyrinic acid a,c-diamide synthase [Hydrogenophaga sp.]HBU19190.1 cobyrinic acid a,c-diamide synthase [Hydrogenophaga sp.]
MKAISVINPKGGSGKSTLATNLAGFLAQRSPAVLLGDIDQQQSCRHWLQSRPKELASIETWRIGADNVARPPKGITHAILDTPAGLSGKALEKVVRVSSRIIVPVQASPFDLWATKLFLDHLAEIKAVTHGKAEVVLVGMRVNSRTLAASQLSEFLARQGFQTLTLIRPTQLYSHVAATGATIFDVPSPLAVREREDWQPLLDWVEAS